ncbi:mRNA export factor GLE1 [Linum grandiflorum]
MKQHEIERVPLKLELRCPQKVHEIAPDPQPDWSFDSLLAELNSLEKKLASSSSFPVPFTKNQSRGIRNGNTVESQRLHVAFSMRVSEEELEVSDDEGNDDTRGLVAAKRFNFDDFYGSETDDSDQEFGLDVQPYLMDEVGLVEGALLERSHDHQLELKEEIRSQFSSLEMELMGKSQKQSQAFARIDEYTEARRETDRKLDTLYQRKIAEALDDHLTAIQRDHELKSQIEERRIRSDAAYEEAKRKERAIQEERIRQERAREEAEAKRKIEEARTAALEAEKKAKEEAAKIEASKNATALVASVQTANLDTQSQPSKSDGTETSLSKGYVVRASEAALTLEEARLQKLRDVIENNQSIMSRSNTNFAAQEKHIGRLIRQLQATEQNIRTKTSDLIKIFNNPSCPQSISVAVFATKVVAYCDTLGFSAFPCAQLIIRVTSQIPYAMDVILAELHKACIYTVPKHIARSKTASDSQEAYYKNHLGFKEENGQIETAKTYKDRMRAYMSLYGALVQTEVPGFQNQLGPKEGWSWLARFLNSLPANEFTAVALIAFLETAGFVLYRKYKSQFGKMLHIVQNEFVKGLTDRNDTELTLITREIESYITNKRFLQEPNGRRMEDQRMLSKQIGVSSLY